MVFVVVFCVTFVNRQCSWFLELSSRLESEIRPWIDADFFDWRHSLRHSFNCSEAVLCSRFFFCFWAFYIACCSCHQIVVQWRSFLVKYIYFCAVINIEVRSKDFVYIPSKVCIVYLPKMKSYNSLSCSGFSVLYIFLSLHDVMCSLCFVAVVAACSIAALVGLVFAGVCWYK